MSIVYRHIRLDKNEPFYVGIGLTEDRAYSTRGRSEFWHKVAKYGYEVEIMMGDLTWEQACEKEKEFIKLYGRKDLGLGTLVNLTDGGDGGAGLIHTQETKEKLRANRLGKSLSQETKEKLRISASGENNPFFNKKRPDHSKRMSGENNPCFGRTGESNPLFGKVGYWKDKSSPRRREVIYEGKKFESQTALAKYLCKSKAYVTKLLKKIK